MSTILFISSENTGHGHKSITESLKEQFEKMDSKVTVEIIDGFSLGGKFSYRLGKLYNPIVVNFPLLWKLCYKIGDIAPWAVNFFNALSIKRNLLKCIKRIKPDLIVPVHPAFVGPALNILQHENLSIPVVPLIADLDNVSYLWGDKRCEYIICPTAEAMDTMLKRGVTSDKLKVLGFPVREKFCNTSPSRYSGISKDKRVKFLLMSGSQGASEVFKIAKTLLESMECQVTILAGSNKALKSKLEKSLLPMYWDKVEICGFTKDVDLYMKQSDILIIRASPNVLIESVNLCKPVIVTGALTGQEEKNPEFVVNHNLGVFCKEISKIPAVINGLLSQEEKGLKEIFESQIRFRDPSAAENIAKFLIQVMGQAQIK